MMKKLLLICLALCLIIITGCQVRNETTKLVTQDLSKREAYLLKLSGNNVLSYNLKNLPQDKDYELQVVYEVYREGEKLKEESIAGIYNDATCEKVKNDTIALNIQENKIRVLYGKDGSASGIYDLEEDLSQYSQAWFGNTANLAIDGEVYIYHAHSGNSSRSTIPLGTEVTSEELNNILNANEDNIFIKIVFKEIRAI